MKPWEETWTVRPFEYELNGAVVTEHDEFVVESENVTFAEMSDRVHATLKAAAPDMARLLLKLEWSGSDDQCEEYCTMCGGSKLQACPPFYQGHREHCDWVKVMRKAGVVE